MIGRLRGIILDKGPEGVLLDVNGVGYEVACPLTVIDQLPPRDSEATLVIHTHVREDQLSLLGFATREERALYRLLVGVSGVGPRLAMACLSGLDSEMLITALVDENVKVLVGIPGIGKRTAERLILELKDKVHKSRSSAPTPAAAPALNDLESALKNLGYKAKSVDTLIEGLRAQAANMTFEQLLREALRRLNT